MLAAATQELGDGQCVLGLHTGSSLSRELSCEQSWSGEGEDGEYDESGDGEDQEGGECDNMSPGSKRKLKVRAYSLCPHAGCFAGVLWNERWCKPCTS